jgi:hypothetical protein
MSDDAMILCADCGYVQTNECHHSKFIIIEEKEREQ